MLEQKVSMFDDLLFIPFEYGKMDCWILVREVFRRYGIEVPEYNPAREAVEKVNYEFGCIDKVMGKELESWISLSEPEVPCMIIYESAGISHHVGVYMGEGKFIHTSRRLVYPVIQRLDNPLYANRKFYRYDSTHSD